MYVWVKAMEGSLESSSMSYYFRLNAASGTTASLDCDSFAAILREQLEPIHKGLQKQRNTKNGNSLTSDCYCAFDSMLVPSSIDRLKCTCS